MFTRSLSLSGLILLLSSYAVAQDDSKKDSVKVLNEVVVQAYATDRPLNEVAAAVGFINQKDLARFNNTSILPAVNMIPGVRMEERSPGSYRFSLRGSLLRSPFGVRNVKMYWNGLPLTDGGGNTYINLLDLNSISNMEIIKGPGASLYGAGTGGVVLLNSKMSDQDPGILSASVGSYGTWRLQGLARIEIPKGYYVLRYAKQQSDGFRNHTKMDRSVLNGDFHINLNDKNSLDFTLLMSELFYETPGGLTRQQYRENPRQARSGASDLNASISNKTIYGGITHNYQWSEHWSTRTGIFLSTSDFVNPTFLNYEERDERNAGGRMVNQYEFEKENWKGKITFGAEYQHFSSPIRNYDNKLGAKDTLRIEDKLISNQTVLFLQGEFDLAKGVIITAGASGTILRYNLARYQPLTSRQKRRFDPVFAPRIAVLKKIGNSHSIYGTISYGFSPPSLSEVRPSTNEFNNGLNPEHGTNYEVGIKGRSANTTFQYEIALFEFDLKETIVIQRTPSNADYFINAGSTRQRGSEISASWSPILKATDFLSSFRILGSYTLNYFHFDDYISDSQTYSGNRLTGVAPNVIALGMDTRIHSKFYINATANYTDHIPLNDANTEYASEYFLFGCRIGYDIRLNNKTHLDVFGGGENLSNQVYSLGNDLNARGGRFFNAAPGRNFYFGVRLILDKGKE